MAYAAVARLQHEVFVLNQSKQQQLQTIQSLERKNETQKATIEQNVKTINEQHTQIKEQHTQIKKLEKRIAQMKGSEKIQEEILALKAKRADAEKKIEREIATLKAKHTEVGVETDKELQERERELEMVEDIKEQGR
ncbi:unnamed protein product [Aureobasidium mustum]|uniref:Uncharacterized protein n=1 Tax=Aureobasidium mustum TaxID=2773714 RepID=A0A9N8JYV0_9PEZI|nr:unnamed protein product [Aureobasidium mustum]